MSKLYDELGNVIAEVKDGFLIENTYLTNEKGESHLIQTSKRLLPGTAHSVANARFIIDFKGFVLEDLTTYLTDKQAVRSHFVPTTGEYECLLINQDGKEVKISTMIYDEFKNSRSLERSYSQENGWKRTLHHK